MPKPLGIDDHWDKLSQHRRELDRLRSRGHGLWHNVGDPDDDASPPFLSGTNAAPTAARPNPVPLRFRWLLGGGIEIQGDVAEVAAGDIVFILPVGYRPDRDLPVNAHDDQGVYVPCRVLSTGEFIYGVA